MSPYARPELLASPEWLAENMGRPEVRLVDVRWRPDGTGRAVYTAGHIPGAVHMDWQKELVDEEESGGALLLAGPEQVSTAMSRAGVGDGTTVVIYDDLASLHAARTWWSLRAYGFDSARILDGGFGAWDAHGRPISNQVTSPEPATFTPHARLRVRLSSADVRGLLGSPDVTIVDARAPAEYKGYEGNARRLGHVPGAVNVPAVITTRPGRQTFRRAEDLHDHLARAGIARGGGSRDHRFVCYDGSGIAAAKLAFVLALLGHEDVAVYDGGWAEWGNRLDLPVER